MKKYLITFLLALFCFTVLPISSQALVWSEYYPGNVLVNGVLMSGEQIRALGASPFELEGTTYDDYDLTIAITDPTVDRTLTIPDESGTLAIIGHENFKVNPVTSAVAGGAASGTAGDTNVMSLGTNIFEYTILGTQTITAPSLTSGGLNISMDLTDNDGVEINQGITERSAYAFTAGTDACYLKVKLYITDASGTDDCAVGFRKAGACNATIDNYPDMAALNVISGDIYTETILNSGATNSTNSTDTWADASSHTLEVRVSAAGVTTFEVDDITPTVIQSFTFDGNDTIVPFFYFLNASDVAESTLLQSWECGPQ